MKLQKFLLSALGLGVALAASAAGSDEKPRFIDPNPGGNCLFTGFADNGKWAVEALSPSEDGSINTVGIRLYDLSSNPPRITEIKDASGLCGAYDVTNDGNIIVGTAGLAPAYWTVSTKKWTKLPAPAGSIGGNLTCVTPDGKYAAGVSYINGEQFAGEVPCMWDLTTNKLIDLKDFPWLDRQNEDQGQNRIIAMSPDGRYLYGCISFSYVQPVAVTPYVYDRETATTRYIGLNKEGGVDDRWGRNPQNPSYLNLIENGTMSHNGKYIASQAHLVKDPSELSANEYYVSCRYDLDSSELNLYDGASDSDYGAFSVGNSGTLYCGNPALSPYRNFCVRYGNYYYSLDQILKQVYDINYEHYGIPITGTPLFISEDEKTIVCMTTQQTSYILSLPEPLYEVCSRVDLLGDWTASPASGSVMTQFSNIQLTFSRKLSTNANNYRNIKLFNADGKQVATALAQGGVSVDGQKLNIQFRTITLEKDAEYTLVIPAGTVWIGDDKETTNKEIRLTYIGRGDGAVELVSAEPADNANVAALSMMQDPIILTFDAQVKINPYAEEKGIPTVATLYYDSADGPQVSGALSVLSATTGDKRTVLVAPMNEIKLYIGNDYRVVVPAGLITDLSGAGDSKEIVLNFHGTYKPDVPEGYLWKTDCNNYNGALFYEGDHRTPVAEVAAMGFNADETPWSVVRESEESSDMAWGSHSMYTDKGQANDWVTTSQIRIPDETAYFTFDSQSWRNGKTDRLKVYVWEHNAILNALTEDIIGKILEEGELVYDEIQKPGKSEDKFTGDWTHNEVSLSKWAHKNIYICFLNDNTDQSMVIIDNIYVGYDVQAGVVLTTPTNVVDKTSAPVAGILTLGDNKKTYTGVKLELKSNDGTVVSTVEDKSYTMTPDDAFNFSFPQELPVTVGEVNDFSIVITLGENKEGENYLSTPSDFAIYDLAFQPERKVVIEEFTGRACPNCPRGIRAIELIEEQFGHQIIPIGLYCYQSDPKGNSVQDYNTFLGMTAAPTGRVNRGPILDPLPADVTGNCFRLSGREYGLGDSWYDQVSDALAQPTYLDVKLTGDNDDTREISFTATVTSAINIDNANIRVFGVLLENGLVDWQQNGIFSLSDPILGEWANNGIYAKARVQDYVFNHAAKATWGTSYNGTSGLIPNNLKANEPIDVTMKLRPSAVVEQLKNCQMVVMLIDGITGEVINANITDAFNGVATVGSEQGAISIENINGAVKVRSALETAVEIYSIDGRKLAAANGNNEYTIDLNGYNGIAIVKAINAETSASVKFIAK